MDNLRIKRLFIGSFIVIFILVVLNWVLMGMYLNQVRHLNQLNNKIDAFKLILQELESERSDLQEEVNLLREKVEINDRLLNENNNLRSTIKKLSFNEGVSRSGVGLHRATPLQDINVQQELGTFQVSYYTPTKEECGSNSGITSSGRPVVGAYTCAADTSIWPYGTVFYVEGLGLVEVMDTGGAVKGRNRLDVCLVTGRDKAFKMGINYRKVWLVKKK
ncbi:MAG: 3D domain-containing protein [Desulfitobacteriaceae bacterium]|nr:3D domain-containing protein [Desulfitobacteriaceae bacterium]